MKIGLVTDSLSAVPFEEMLNTAAELGIEQVEIATGRWSEAPHIDIDLLLSDEGERDRFVGAVKERGLTISALNANGNQLHPVIGSKVDGVVRKTVQLAGLMGIDTVVLMSGLPGGGPQDLNPNWVTTSWPPETQTILDYQWNQVAIPYWRDLAEHGRRAGIRFAVEMHGAQLVYNAATLLRLREAVGDIIGANLDPSHPMWMGADPRAVARALTGVIHIVHAKDARFQPHAVEVNGVLGTQPPDQAADRPWNYVTLGLGYPGGAQFWGQFLCDLRAAGYDGALSIEHEDVQMDAVEGLAQTVALLKSVMLVKPPSWRPAAI